MIIDIELNIPPKFFESAKEENDFESISERIAKLFITSILNIPDIRRGNAEFYEPDYVSGENGYEITFAIRESHIPQLKGVKPVDFTTWNIEQELIDNISVAIERKAGKTYSHPTSLVIITLESLYTWYHSVYTKETDWFEKLAWNVYTKRRNDFFNKIFQNYIESETFNNIYVIQPTHNREFALFDIKKYATKCEEFITLVGVSHPEFFPTYSVINIKKETSKEPIKLRTTIINRQ